MKLLRTPLYAPVRSFPIWDCTRGHPFWCWLVPFDADWSCDQIHARMNSLMCSLHAIIELESASITILRDQRQLLYMTGVLYPLTVSSTGKATTDAILKNSLTWTTKKKKRVWLLLCYMTLFFATNRLLTPTITMMIIAIMALLHMKKPGPIKDGVSHMVIWIMMMIHKNF